MTGRILHFLVGEKRYGLRIADITEIREITGTTSVPGAPEVIAGLTDIRGQIVTLVDLAKVYGYTRPRTESLLAVQLAEPHSHLGVLVPGGVHDLQTEPAVRDEPEPAE